MRSLVAKSQGFQFSRTRAQLSKTPSHFLEAVPEGVTGKEGMGKFSPVFPMTWVLFKGAPSHDWSFFGRSGERREDGEAESWGPGAKEEKKRLHERERSETTNFCEGISD